MREDCMTPLGLVNVRARHSEKRLPDSGDGMNKGRVMLQS